MQEPIRFEIVDRHTGRVVGCTKTRANARRAVDRRDNEYGGYRYGFREVFANGDSRVGI